MSASLRTYGLWPTRLLYPWDFPATPLPPKKARFWERAHGQRPLKTQGWEGLPGGVSVRKIQVYPRSGQEPQLPGLAMDTAQHPFSLPSVCPAPLFSGVLGSILWYLLGSRHSCLFVGLCEGWNALNDSLQHWKAGPRTWG
jgi:hypothetical protein